MEHTRFYSEETERAPGKPQHNPTTRFVNPASDQCSNPKFQHHPQTGPQQVYQNSPKDPWQGRRRGQSAVMEDGVAVPRHISQGQRRGSDGGFNGLHYPENPPGAEIENGSALRPISQVCRRGSGEFEGYYSGSPQSFKLVHAQRPFCQAQRRASFGADGYYAGSPPKGYTGFLGDLSRSPPSGYMNEGGFAPDDGGYSSRNQQQQAGSYQLGGGGVSPTERGGFPPFMVRSPRARHQEMPQLIMSRDIRSPPSYRHNVDAGVMPLTNSMTKLYRDSVFQQEQPRDPQQHDVHNDRMTRELGHRQTMTQQAIRSPPLQHAIQPQQQNIPVQQPVFKLQQTPSSPPVLQQQQQQHEAFHHPHFNHHRARHSPLAKSAAVQSPAQSQNTSMRSTPRSLSVSENSGENQIAFSPRHLPKSSYSLDYPSIEGQAPPVLHATASSLSSQPVKRGVAVTDLDQAAQEMDESRLRALFGDHTQKLYSPNINIGYSANGNHFGFGETDVDHVDETNLDDDPFTSKYGPSTKQEPDTAKIVNDHGASSEESSVGFLDCMDEQPEKELRQSFSQQGTAAEESIRYPVDMPPSLHFNQSDVFEGQLLLQWLSNQFDSSHYLSLILTKHDIVILMSQFCTCLLAAGVLSLLHSGHNLLREFSFKPNAQYFWTKQDPLQGQTELPGRLQPMWPPIGEDNGETMRPGLKYSEAEQQAAMVLIRRDYNQQMEKLKKEHVDEIDRLHIGYQLRIEDLRAELARRDQDVEKYRQFAGLERLSQTALSHAQAAQDEAGLSGGSILTTPDDRGVLHRDSVGSHGHSVERKMLDFSHVGDDSPQMSALPSDPFDCKDLPQPPPAPPAPWGPAPPPPAPPPPGGALPPAPPLPGSVPPPPPHGLAALKKVPSKPIVNTKSPMKPLFWKRIQVNNLKAIKQESTENKFIWESVEEAQLNLDELDDLFSKVPIQPQKKSKDMKPKTKQKQSAKVIEAKRSQAVGIMLSTIRMEMSDIEYAILHLDTTILDAEKFKAIYENRPQDDEIKLITKQLEKQPDTLLDKPEQFLYDLHQIPNYADRIYCFIFQSTFQENISVIESKLNNLKMTCEMLMSGVTVKRIFGILLAFGNYMNGGSRTRGQADGFELDILPKLKDYKAKDNRTSLMHYLVMVYVQRYELDDAGTDKVKLPIPDPSDITQASLVNFDDTYKEIARIRRDFELAESKAAVVLRECTDETKEPFQLVMTSFFEKGKQELADQDEAMKECAKRFSETVQFFYAKPKAEDKVVTPEHFFSMWLSFCHDFKDHWKKEQQRIIKLRIKETEERVRKLQESKKAVSIPTRAKTAGGLKDRLQRLSKK